MIISYHHESNGFISPCVSKPVMFNGSFSMAYILSNEFRGVLLFSLRQAHENPK
jgi:hypothetical protein